ncbi:hypothetical protein BDW72DRAFT_186280 [Aspergillus terricola var. indicus]
MYAPSVSSACLCSPIVIAVSLTCDCLNVYFSGTFRHQQKPAWKTWINCWHCWCYGGYTPFDIVSLRI